jgi:hypothetical protein
MEVSGQLHAPSALPPGKQIRYALCKAGWTAESVWTLWRSENPLDLPVIESRNSPLYRLSYPGCVLTCEVNRNCHVTTKGHELVRTVAQSELKRAVGFVDCAANRSTQIACCANDMWCFCMGLSWKFIYIAKIMFLTSRRACIFQLEHVHVHVPVPELLFHAPCCFNAPPPTSEDCSLIILPCLMTCLAFKWDIILLRL